MDNIYFETPIPGKGFEWRNDIVPLPDDFIPDESQANPPYLTMIKSETGKIVHPIDEKPFLYREFANLWPSMDNIKDFASKYGLIKYEFAYNSYPLRNGITTEDRILICSLYDWQSEIKNMHMMFFFLNVIKNDDYSYAEKIIQITPNFIRVKAPADDLFPKWVPVVPIGDNKPIKSQYNDIVLKLKQQAIPINNKLYIEPFNRIHIETQPLVFDALKKNDPLNILKYMLIRKINDIYEKHIKIKYLLKTDFKALATERYLIPDSLATALYTQIERDLTNSRELRKCEYCGEWFVVTDKRQRYCPEFIKVPIKDEYGEIIKYKKIPTGKHCKVYAFRNNH